MKTSEFQSSTNHETNNKPNYALRRILAVAALGATLFGGIKVAEAIDEATSKVVDTVTETVDYGSDLISTTERAVKKLEVDSDDVNETELGQKLAHEIDGPVAPGTQVTYTETKHLFGENTVDGELVKPADD